MYVQDREWAKKDAGAIHVRGRIHQVRGQKNNIATNEHNSWTLSPLSTHSDMGLITTYIGPSDIVLRGDQSNIISDIGLTFLAISTIFESG